MDYGKRTLHKILSKSWMEPAGMAMRITASHLEMLHSWGAGTCFLKGALAVGSSMLNPPMTADDIAKQPDAREANTNKTGENDKDALQQKLKDTRNMILMKNFNGVIKEAQGCVKNLAEDLEYFEDELENFRKLFVIRFNRKYLFVLENKKLCCLNAAVNCI